jgi:hypothetical protein
MFWIELILILNLYKYKENLNSFYYSGDFTFLLDKIEATNGAAKFASATFHLVEVPELNINIKK